MQYTLHLLRTGPHDLEGLDFERRVDRLRAAAEQRSLGAYLALQGGEGRFSPFKGGVQRLLRAAEAIPAEVFSAIAGFKWPGFTLVGTDRRYWHAAGTVNLPLEAAFRPSLWWGLTHETGHVLLKLHRPWLDFDARFVEEIETKTGRQAGTHLFNDAVDTISEIFLDIYDYTLFFRGRLECYLRSVWQYLETDLRSDPERLEALSIYALRSFFVVLKNRKRTDISGLKYGEVKTELDAFMRSLDTFAPGLAQELSAADLRSAVLEEFATYKAFASRMLESVSRANELYQAQVRRVRPQTRRALASVMAGRVFDGNFSASELVHDLNYERIKTGSHLSWKTELAALLSLCAGSGNFVRSIPEILSGRE